MLSIPIFIYSLTVDDGANVLDEHRHSHRVETTLGDDDIGIAFRWLDKLLVHRLHRSGVLRDDRLHRSSSLTHIAQDASCQAHIGIGIDKDLDIQDVAQLLILENEDSVDDDNLRRLDSQSLLRAVVLHKRVGWAIDRLTLLESLDMLDHKPSIEGLGVVVVELCALLVGQLRVGFVIKIMIASLC